MPPSALPSQPMSRPLLLDGITIQLVGELLFEVGSTPQERWNAKELYREALEDFAYAVVFGVELGRVGSLSERNGAYPGQEVIGYDKGNLFDSKNVLPAAAGPAEGVLLEPRDRQAIAAELRLLRETFPPPGGVWVPYLRQEAATGLPDEPIPNETEDGGAQFLFPKKRETYFHDLELQQEISPELVTVLVTSLRTLLPNRRPDDFPEFVKRALLTHYGISCSYENSARAADFQRLPFETRSWVRYHAIQRATTPDSSSHVLSKVDSAKATVLSSALTVAFSRFRTGRRRLLYDQLVDLRKPYADHRKLLADIDFYSRPDNFNASMLSDACDKLDHALEGQPTMSAINTNHWPMSNFLLPPGLPLIEYADAAFHLFPEFGPAVTSTATATFIPSVRMIRNRQELIEVLSESLKRLESSLQGTAPAAEELWDEQLRSADN